MSEASAQIAMLIRKSDRTPWGPECGSILAEAIAVADAAGEAQYGYAARMRQCMNASFGNDYELLLATFAVCERLHSDDPVAFPANPKDMGAPGAGYGYADLYWMWKWIPTALRVSPDFPASAIEETITELDAAYDRVGAGRKAVLQRRLSWATDRGLAEEAVGWADQLAALPDDDYADCAACSRSELIEARLLAGDEGGALTLLEEIAEGGFDCSDEPATAYSSMLDVLARASAVQRVATGVEEILSAGASADVVSAQARLAIFLTRCGQTGRALSLARRMLAKVDDAPLDVATHETLLLAAAVACAAATAEGHGDAPVPEADAPYLARYLGRVDGGHTVATLAVAAASAARRIAAAFDARNGTGAHAVRVAEVLDADVHYDIALAMPIDPEAAFANEVVGAESLFRIDDPVTPEPTDSAEALAAVFNLAHFGRPLEALELGRRWLPRLEDPLDRALLLHRLATAMVEGDPDADASDLAAESLEALRLAGHGDLANALAALGRWYYSDPHEDDFAEIRATVSALEAAGTAPDVVGFALTCVPAAYATPEHYAWADEAMVRAESVVDRLGRPPLWTHLPVGGRLNLLTFLDGDRDTEKLGQLIADMPGPLLDRTRAALANDRATVLAAAGDTAGALEQQLEAFTLASRWASAPVRAMAALRLADAAEADGRAAEVLAAGLFLERLAPGLAPRNAASVLLHVASCEEGVGQSDAAFSHVEQAHTALGVMAEPDYWLLGIALRALGLHRGNANRARDAACDFLAAAEAFENAGRPDDAAEAALLSANAELRLGNIVAAGQLAEAVLESLPGLEQPWVVEMKARHMLADATSRAGLDVDVVESAYAAALAVADIAPDADARAASRAGLLLSLAKWRHDVQKRPEAAEAAREARALAERLGDTERAEKAAITLAWALGVQDDNEAAQAEAASIVAAMLAYSDTSVEARTTLQRLSTRLARTDDEQDEK